MDKRKMKDLENSFMPLIRRRLNLRNFTCKYIVLWLLSIMVSIWLTKLATTSDFFECSRDEEFLTHYRGHRRDDGVSINNNAKQELSESIAHLRELQSAAASKSKKHEEVKSSYDRNMPLIFVGGMPRSGTTLMRALLDAHPSIRCGEETHVIPRILSISSNWMKSGKEAKRFEEAGITKDVLDRAVSSFILEIIVNHGDHAEYYCNKDPLVLLNTTYVKKLFPNAKFILMIRDGRAVVHSIISRKVRIGGFNITDYRDCLTRWNKIIENMYSQCIKIGSKSCMTVNYEELVLHPEDNTRAIFKFLGIPWHENVLNHEKLIGNEISLSKVEPSSDQVVKPINLDSLTSWVGHIPGDVVADMEEIAPMLRKLGYDPNANPPKYGEADQRVKENTQKIKENEDYWYERAEQYSELFQMKNLQQALADLPF